MPYIEQSERSRFDALATAAYFNSPGDLNYFITRLVMTYIRHKGEVNYANIAEVTGILENVKQEFYRRVASPYEDKKCQQNGDVY